MNEYTNPKKFFKKLKIPVVSWFQGINWSLADVLDTINSLKNFTINA